MRIGLDFVMNFIGWLFYKISSNRDTVECLTCDVRIFTKIFKTSFLSLFFIATLMGAFKASASVEAEKAKSKAQIINALKGNYLIITASTWKIKKKRIQVKCQAGNSNVLQLRVLWQ